MRKLYTLENISISFEELNATWKCDKRYGVDTLRRFVALNKCAFDFIGVRANIDSSLGKALLQLSTSNYPWQI